MSNNNLVHKRRRFCYPRIPGNKIIIGDLSEDKAKKNLQKKIDRLHKLHRIDDSSDKIERLYTVISNDPYISYLSLRKMLSDNNIDISLFEFVPIEQYQIAIITYIMKLDVYRFTRKYYLYKSSFIEKLIIQMAEAF
jgi:hypothetical protein